MATCPASSRRRQQHTTHGSQGHHVGALAAATDAHRSSRIAPRIQAAAWQAGGGPTQKRHARQRSYYARSCGHARCLTATAVQPGPSGLRRAALGGSSSKPPCDRQPDLTWRGQGKAEHWARAILSKSPYDDNSPPSGRPLQSRKRSPARPKESGHVIRPGDSTITAPAPAPAARPPPAEQQPAAGVEVSLSYHSGWEQPVLHYSLAGGAWQTRPLTLVRRCGSATWAGGRVGHAVLTAGMGSWPGGSPPPPLPACWGLLDPVAAGSCTAVVPTERAGWAACCWDGCVPRAPARPGGALYWGWVPGGLREKGDAVLELRAQRACATWAALCWGCALCWRCAHWAGGLAGCAPPRAGAVWWGALEGGQLPSKRRGGERAGSTSARVCRHRWVGGGGGRWGAAALCLTADLLSGLSSLMGGWWCCCGILPDCCIDFLSGLSSPTGVCWWCRGVHCVRLHCFALPFSLSSSGGSLGTPHAMEGCRDSVDPAALPCCGGL